MNRFSRNHFNTNNDAFRGRRPERRRSRSPNNQRQGQGYGGRFDRQSSQRQDRSSRRLDDQSFPRNHTQRPHSKNMNRTLISDVQLYSRRTSSANSAEYPQRMNEPSSDFVNEYRVIQFPSDEFDRNDARLRTVNPNQENPHYLPQNSDQARMNRFQSQDIDQDSSSRMNRYQSRNSEIENVDMRVVMAVNTEYQLKTVHRSQQQISDVECSSRMNPFQSPDSNGSYPLRNDGFRAHDSEREYQMRINRFQHSDFDRELPTRMNNTQSHDLDQEYISRMNRLQRANLDQDCRPTMNRFQPQDLDRESVSRMNRLQRSDLDEIRPPIMSRFQPQDLDRENLSRMNRLQRSDLDEIRPPIMSRFQPQDLDQENLSRMNRLQRSDLDEIRPPIMSRFQPQDLNQENLSRMNRLQRSDLDDVRPPIMSRFQPQDLDRENLSRMSSSQRPDLDQQYPSRMNRFQSPEPDQSRPSRLSRFQSPDADDRCPTNRFQLPVSDRECPPGLNRIELQDRSENFAPNINRFQPHDFDPPGINRIQPSNPNDFQREKSLKLQLTLNDINKQLNELRESAFQEVFDRDSLEAPGFNRFDSDLFGSKEMTLNQPSTQPNSPRPEVQPPPKVPRFKSRKEMRALKAQFKKGAIAQDKWNEYVSTKLQKLQQNKERIQNKLLKSGFNSYEERFQKRNNNKIKRLFKAPAQAADPKKEAEYAKEYRESHSIPRFTKPMKDVTVDDVRNAAGLCGNLVVIYLMNDEPFATLERTSRTWDMPYSKDEKYIEETDKWQSTCTLNGIVLAKTEAPTIRGAKLSCAARALWKLFQWYFTIVKGGEVAARTVNNLELKGDERVKDMVIYPNDKSQLKFKTTAHLFNFNGCLEDLKKMIVEYSKDTSNFRDLVFSNDFNAKTRKSLLKYAKRTCKNLQTNRRGGKWSRQIVFSKKLCKNSGPNGWDLVEDILKNREVYQSTKEFRLFFPGQFQHGLQYMYPNVTYLVP